jgi:hypothetical protein
VLVARPVIAFTIINHHQKNREYASQQKCIRPQKTTVEATLGYANAPFARDPDAVARYYTLTASSSSHTPVGRVTRE